jgi:primosomal protein N'
MVEGSSMTVTVTKLGVKPTDKKYSLKCQNCSTEIECNHSDLQIFISRSQDQRDSDYGELQCPLCKETIRTYNLGTR